MKFNLLLSLLFSISITQFAMGQNSTLPGTHLLKLKEKLKIDKCKIQFLKVIEDSRCPTGAQCIVPGTVSVLLRINGTQYTISSKQSHLSIQQNDINYQIELLDVIPHPIAKQSNDFSKYQSKLSISKT